MEYIKLNVFVVLKHILDFGQSPALQLDDSEDDSDDDDNKYEDEDDLGLDSSKDGNRKRNGPRTAARKRQRRRHLTSSRLCRMDLLDLDGPKLIIGARTWLVFYQIIGILNWLGKPLYLSIIYKIIVFTIVLTNFFERFMEKVSNLNIIDPNYRNPIFLFISLLTGITLFLQVLVSLRANLLDLCPFFKILTTPKLCFVRTEVQHIVGSRWLTQMLIFYVYHCLVLCMFLSKDFNHFIDEFSLSNFLLDLYTTTVLLNALVGVCHLDLYVRSCFGHWLLALKNHIESRFTYLHRHQKRIMKLRNQSNNIITTTTTTSNINNNSGNSMDALSMSETITTYNTATMVGQSKPLLTFDEIQKQLNKMDDHLEAMRSVQIGELVLLSLNAFLLDGALFLLSYHLLADQHNFYHGFLVLLMAINCIIIIFFCYYGDRWVFYALSSLTQTVEDEYFMQSDIKPMLSNSLAQQQQQAALASNNRMHSNNPSIIEQQLNNNNNTSSDTRSNYHNNHQMLLIKKKDVLFCHEFLHQFENHLATPWSNLTVKTHLHMLRTFVTLIAAQIIFDHEH